MMTDSGPQNVRRDYVGGNVRFDFPCRPLGRARWFGLIPVAFGLSFMWVPGHRAGEFLQKLLHGDHSAGTIIFSVFPLLFVLAGCVPIGIGLAILFGRCRVEWCDGQLCATELVGPLRWTRRLPRRPIRKLEVSVGSSRSGNNPPQPMNNFTGIIATFADGTRKVVVFGYPKDWVLPVAEELRAQIGGSWGAVEPLRVEVVDRQQPSPLADDEVAPRPTTSNIQCEQHGAEIKIVIPPRGLWKGSMGMFFFSLIWNGFMAVFTTMFFLPGTHRQVSTGVFLLIISGFWLVGIGLLLAALNMGRRRAEIVGDATQLTVRTDGIFGAKERQWSRGDIAAIRADAGSMEVNDRPVIELQIHPANGKKIGLLAGRTEPELRWLAAELRRKLGVPAR